MRGIQNSVLTRPRPSVQDVHKRNGNNGAPSPTAQSEIESDVEKELRDHIDKEREGLKRRFFNGDLDAARIDQATKMFTKLRAKECPRKEALNLSILVLYDLVILIGLQFTPRKEQ